MGLWGGCQPALFIKQSIRPCLATTASTNRSISSVRETSQRIKCASAQTELVDFLCELNTVLLVREQKTTRDPAETKARTQPSPIPLLPPVIITTLSVYSILIAGCGFWSTSGPRELQLIKEAILRLEMQHDDSPWSYAKLSFNRFSAYFRIKYDGKNIYCHAST